MDAETDHTPIALDDTGAATREANLEAVSRDIHRAGNWALALGAVSLLGAGPMVIAMLPDLSRNLNLGPAGASGSTLAMTLFLISPSIVLVAASIAVALLMCRFGLAARRVPAAADGSLTQLAAAAHRQRHYWQWSALLFVLAYVGMAVLTAVVTGALFFIGLAGNR